MRIEPVTREYILEDNGIYFENIEDGFATCATSIYVGSEPAYIKFLEKCIELNSEAHSYFDFYYYTLSADGKDRLHGFMTKEDEVLLDQLNTDSREIYFPLNKEILPLPARLTAREWFFSSFYFTKEPCLIWGNYDRRYPAFFRDEATAQIYDKLAESCKLKVEYLSRRGYRMKKTRKIYRGY